MSTGAIMLLCLFALAGGIFVGDIHGWHKGFEQGCKWLEDSEHDDTLHFYHGNELKHEANEANEDKL